MSVYVGLCRVMSGYVGLSRSEENFKSPDHCDRAGSSLAPGTNQDPLKPKFPASIISKILAVDAVDAVDAVADCYY